MSLLIRTISRRFFEHPKHYRSQMVNLKVKVPEGVQHFPEGVQLFPGGGSNSWFPIETHITCDFPGGGGGPDPLSPPLDLHLRSQQFFSNAGVISCLPGLDKY